MRRDGVGGGGKMSGLKSGRVPNLLSQGQGVASVCSLTGRLGGTLTFDDR